jgi:NitT/TauT family transport system substrate-binding protein
VRLPKVLGVCVSPRYAAEELLRGEGFTDIRYVETPAAAVPEAIGQGKLDFGLNYAPLLIPAIDAAEPVMVLAGAHVGCFELFAKEDIRNVADLKGRSVGVQDWGSTAHVLVTLMAAHVGLDPVKDIRQDHRRRHRLALLQRAKTRAEAVSADWKGGLQCR